MVIRPRQNGRRGPCAPAPAPPRRGDAPHDEPDAVQEPNRAAYLRVENEVRLTRYGGDCYAYCALAAGFVDLVVETSIKPHDIVALIPIIEGAGGLVTTWDGEEAAKGGQIIAAGDPAVHEQARRILVQG